MKNPICCPSIRIPRLDLGTWFIENGRAARTVRNAVDIGCRHFDTAQASGNERGRGDPFLRIPRWSCSSPPSWPLRPNPTIGRQRVRYLVKNKED